jgi:hypothetical protein
MVVVVGFGAVVVVVVGAAMKSLVNVTVQVTVLPPPFDDPLHWLIVTGSAVAAPVTSHCTRVLGPPPLAEPLHWVTLALVVLATGAHTTVGWVPPPPPDPTHWSTVTPEVAWPVGMVFTTETLQITLEPPPSTTPLHWSTDVTSWFAVLTVVVHPEGGSTPAAARHDVAVTVEEVAPAAVTVLSIVMLQLTSNPAPVGKAGGSHWVAAGADAAAEAAWVPMNPPTTSMPAAVIATRDNIKPRRTTSVASWVRDALMSTAPPCGTARKWARKAQTKWPAWTSPSKSPK